VRSRVSLADEKPLCTKNSVRCSGDFQGAIIDFIHFSLRIGQVGLACGVAEFIRLFQ
jgi:hypothetical protein